MHTHDQWWLVPQSRQICECGDQGPYNGQLEDWWYHAWSVRKNQISHLYQKSNQINLCIPWRAYTAAHFVQIWPETVIEYLCATGFKCDGLWVGIELFQMEVVPEHHRRRGCGGTCCQVHYRPWIGCSGQHDGDMLSMPTIYLPAQWAHRSPAHWPHISLFKMKSLIILYTAVCLPESHNWIHNQTLVQDSVVCGHPWGKPCCSRKTVALSFLGITTQKHVGV